MTFDRYDNVSDTHPDTDPLDLSAYDHRCDSCGAIYFEHPGTCPLCGSDVFHPAEDLAW